MKITNVIKYTLAAALALSFVGCKFNGTVTDFSKMENNVTAVVNDTMKGAFTSVSLDSYSWDKAKTEQECTVTFKTTKKLDPESVGAAVKFFSLKDNAANKYAFLEHDAELVKTQIDYVVSETSGTVKTEIIYYVDSLQVTTDKIEFFCDAAALKDVAGNVIMNCDNDDVAGEESDSYAKEISLTSKSDGTATTALNGFIEKFCPSFLGNISATEDTVNGKLTFTVTTNPTSAADGTIVYDSQLADIVNQILIYQTRTQDTNDWTDVPLNFSFDSTLNGYKSEQTYPTLGTEWRTIYVRKPGLVDTKTAAFYGHQGYVYYGSIEKKTVLTYQDFSGKSIYYATSPEYIAHDVDNTQGPATFVKGNITTSDITTYQKGVLTISSAPTAAPFYWDITSSVALSAYEDFKVFDKDGNRLASKVIVLSKNNDGATKIRLSLENKYYSTTGAEVWVGPATKIFKNTQYPSEVSFGCLPVRGDTYHKGYVKLN